MIKITLERNENDSQFAFADGRKLFQFEWRDERSAGPGWFFWLRGAMSPDKFMQEDFPVDFFKQAVEAKTFISFGKKYTGIDGAELDRMANSITK